MSDVNSSLQLSKLDDEMTAADGDEADDDDEHNITLTGMIENIVSPNKKSATSSSSSNSSKNTSPQLPIFSSAASSTAQLVTTINQQQMLTISRMDSHDNCSTESPAFNMAASSANKEITFTLSDDEIEDNSNASSHNMQNAVSLQTAVQSPAPIAATTNLIMSPSKVTVAPLKLEEPVKVEQVKADEEEVVVEVSPLPFHNHGAKLDTSLDLSDSNTTLTNTVTRKDDEPSKHHVKPHNLLAFKTATCKFDFLFFNPS